MQCSPALEVRPWSSLGTGTRRYDFLVALNCCQMPPGRWTAFAKQNALNCWILAADSSAILERSVAAGPQEIWLRKVGLRKVGLGANPITDWSGCAPRSPPRISHRADARSRNEATLCSSCSTTVDRRVRLFCAILIFCQVFAEFCRDDKPAPRIAGGR